MLGYNKTKQKNKSQFNTRMLDLKNKEKGK